jgi:hypothetical protein
MITAGLEGSGQNSRREAASESMYRSTGAMTAGADLTGDDLWRVEYLGQRDGGEIFNHGMWVDAGTGGVDADGVLDTAVVFLSTWLASSAVSSGSDMQHIYPNDVHWTEIRATPWVQATNLPSAPSTPRTNTISGAGGFSPLPYQCSVVASWFNGRLTGRLRYNRSYTPGPSITVIGSQGKLSSAFCGDLATALAAANAAMLISTPALFVCYYGGTHHEMLGLDSVIVDDVPDIQRRRVDQLVPTKHSASL